MSRNQSTLIAMNRDTWTQLPAGEWKRRLSRVRELALQRLAAHGTGDADDESIGSMIAYGDVVSPLLNPVLAVERDRLDQIIEPVPKAESAAIGFAIEVAETAFLFGMITGSHLSWPVIEAMPAPYAPQRTANRKGGALP